MIKMIPKNMNEGELGGWELTFTKCLYEMNNQAASLVVHWGKNHPASAGLTEILIPGLKIPHAGEQHSY